jgi:predicted transposase/invertase (TIGR01784 family)
MGNDTNRVFKNSVFTLIFSDPVKMLRLYNAVAKTDIPLGTHVDVATLSNALYLGRINDMAFIVDGKLVILIEHQSTICGNMPIRLLLYIVRIYDTILDSKAIYRTKQIKIPRPEFYVLYNGKEDYPETATMRLSDAFIGTDAEKAKGLLELEVKVYNINSGFNEDIVSRSEELDGYVAFVSKVREYQAAGHSLEDSVAYAIDYCISKSILSEFLEKHASEVRNMLTAEFNLDIAKAIWREEALEEGMEKGLEKGLEKGEASKAQAIAKKLLKRNRPIDEIIEDTGLTRKEVESLRDAG